MRIRFPNKSANEGFARVAVAAFASQLDPTLEELADIKTAVSEAVTNAIVHGYQNGGGEIKLYACYYDTYEVRITVKDSGIGIEDVRKAMEPLFTTDTTGERSGMGFAIMQSFCDKLRVTSAPNKGTTVTMEKRLIPRR